MSAPAPAAWRADVREACLALAAAHGLAGLAAVLLLALGA